MRLTGKVALITGGGSGIGEAVARLLAERGVAVVVTDIHLDAAQRVADSIKADGGSAAAFAANVSNPGDSKASVDFAVETFGALHVAVNNAGIGGTLGPAADLPPNDWDTVIGTIGFDAKGDLKQSAYVWYVFKGGNYSEM